MFFLFFLVCKHLVKIVKSIIFCHHLFSSKVNIISNVCQSVQKGNPKAFPNIQSQSDVGIYMHKCLLELFSLTIKRFFVSGDFLFSSTINFHNYYDTNL